MAEHDPSAPALFEVSDLAPTSTSFMDLEDPRYAYMFGFLQADGHLQAGAGLKGKLTVEINVRARTTINQLGIPYGRKSKRVTPPRVEFSRRDYLRGVIDADGSVGYTGQGLPFLSLTTASSALGAYLCHYAKKVTGAGRQIKRNARDEIYNIVYTKEAAVKLAEHFYYPGCLSLERKQSAAESLASWERPTGMRVRPPSRRWKPWEDRILLGLDDDDASAVELGRTKASCAVRLWRLKTGAVSQPSDDSPSL